MINQLFLPGASGPVEIPEPEGFVFAGKNLGDIISQALVYVFPFAGLILFFVLISGGFQLLTAAGNPENTAKGYKKIIFAFVGFLIVFAAYWLVQIIETILGIKVF